MRHIYIFLLFAFSITVLFSSGQIENPDTHLRLTQTRIIIDENKFGLSEDVGEESHGNIAINRDGQRYMVYNPGHTITFIPIYYLANILTSDDGDAYYLSAFFISFLNYIIHALCAYLLFRIIILLDGTIKQALLTSMFFGLTSYSFVFAQSTYEHHFEMLFILLSTFLALKRDTSYTGYLSGLMLSTGMIFRTTSILAIPAIFLLVNDNKERLKVGATLLIGVLFLGAYNYIRFDSPFESGYSIAWKLAHHDRFDYWSLSNLSSAMFGFVFSPGKGLLFFSTTLIISLWYIRPFFILQRKMSFFIMTISLSYLVFFSLNFAWHGSIWSFGPRYILPILPFLYLPLVYIKPQKWVFLTLAIAFLIQIVPISVNYKREVLSDFIVNNRLSDMEYLNSFSNEPHLAQAKQLAIILPKNCKGLNNFMPDSPWKKEIRTASNQEVLNSSIEKNSINFWWIRIFHLSTSLLSRILTVCALLFAFYISYILFRHVKREFV